MKNYFEAAVLFVLKHECVYASGHEGDLAYVVTEDVAGDGGGVTKYGIDQRDHPGIDVAGLTLEGAIAIYRNGEWTQCLCDSLPSGLDLAVFDEAVNTGCRESVLLLQHAITLAGTAVEIDGEIGPMTVAATLAICARQGGGAALLASLLALRRTYYRLIAEHNPGEREFLAGWLDRVADLAAYLGGDSARQEASALTEGIA